MDFEKDYLDEKEPLDVEEDFEKPELTKGTTRDTDPQYFTNIDGIYAKDAAGRAAVEELRTLVTEYIGDYSTTERKIGKWIDGSDLYQRTFVVTGLINANWNKNVLGTSGINIVDVQGWIDWWTYGGEPEIRTSLDYYASNVDYVGLQITYNDLCIRPYRNADIGDATVTIQYTKPVVSLSNNIQTVNEPNEEPTEGEDMRSEPIEQEEPVEEISR